MTEPTPIAESTRSLEIGLAITALENYWLAHPHLRLAQIVVNAAHRRNLERGNGETSSADVFMTEDTDLMRALALLP